MAVTLITGGARSGKSRLAETLALRLPGPHVYVATAEALDTEMAERIARHREGRGPAWQLIEEPLDLPDAIDRSRGAVRVVDCLTLWLSNLMHHGRDWQAEAERLIAALARAEGAVFLVTNELGSGIVPENALARRFRDAAGLLNQRVAAVADEVLLAVAGQPLSLKTERRPTMNTRPTAIPALTEWRARLARLPGPDTGAAAAAAAREAELTKPPGSLGRLEEMAIFMAGWQGRARPVIGRAQALVFAGNHGICAQGVNPFPQAVTAQMVANFQAGGAAINQLSALAGATLSVVPLELDRPTADFTQGPAMTEAELAGALAAGAGAVDPGADVLILGEMGIGNSTIAAALAAASFGGTAADWVGPGTGSDAAGIVRKVSAVDRGLALHAGAKGLGALLAFGGREQAAICGAVIAARERRIPVILDGFICTAAAAVLPHEAAGALDHCLVGHQSAEPGHSRLLSAIGKEGLVDLGLRLGEGSGAALGLLLLRAALACHDGMATFAEAGVADG